MTTREEVGWDLAEVAELSLVGLLNNPGDRDWMEEVTWAGMTCLTYLLR
jgi:hypothetical protein